MAPLEKNSAEKLRLTVLGSGTSMGVPTLGCACRVCRSSDPRDNRTRPSVLLTVETPSESVLFAAQDASHSTQQMTQRHVVIDTSPDFRQQCLRAGVRSLAAAIYTHGHADHILGLDDIRPFNLKQQSNLPVYASRETLVVLMRTFSYIFEDAPSQSTLPGVELHEIDGPFYLFAGPRLGTSGETIGETGVKITPVAAWHGEMPVLGFRFGRAAYLTDFSRIPESSLPLLEDLDDLILDALRDVPHPMHSTVAQSLELVGRLRPKRAWFTHISHDLAHEETNARLPPNVRLAYDGLNFEVAI